MTVNVTPEVAFAHKNLQELCEKFETSIEELCARLPRALPPGEFYQCDCASIAAECAETLFIFPTVYSYEFTAYEKEVAEVNNELRQQKRELEENAPQKIKAYEDAVTEADNKLYQQKREFQENAAQKTKAYEDAVTEADNKLYQQKWHLQKTAIQRIRTVQSEVGKFLDVAKTVGVSLADCTSIDPTELLGKGQWTTPLQSPTEKH